MSRARDTGWRAHRHANWWAFAVHRVSGVLLVLFLPAHFTVLALAIRGTAPLEGFLRWTDQPLVKAAETVLVILLAAHLAGGLRLLAVEFLPWRDWQKNVVAIAAGVSLLVGLAFALSVF